MAAYDDFAWFYDRYWSHEFHSVAFPVLERIWLPRLAPAARILDVCCGTGYLAGLLAERGWTDAELAARAGLDRAHLNQVKNGRALPTVATALVLSRALGVPVAAIFSSERKGERGP